jgi:two-component SAPR family response regulator
VSRIIVFDDDPDSGNLLRRLLERSGHAVSLIAEPERVKEEVCCSAPDLVILRLRVGNRKAEHFPLQLRSLLKRPRIMTISGRAPSTPDELADEHYLMEPVELDAIDRKVQQILET